MSQWMKAEGARSGQFERVEIDGVRHYVVDGRPLPSVTEVLACVREPGLETWQIEYSVKNNDARAAEQFGMLAAQYGTMVHDLITTEQDPDYYAPKEVRTAMLSWKELRKDWDFEIVDSEYAVATIDYAGTVDLKVVIRAQEGKKLLELKTSSVLRDRAAVQAEAYFRADPEADGVLVVRLGKSKVEYEVREPDHAVAWKTFQAALTLFYNTNPWDGARGFVPNKKPQDLTPLREFA